MDEKLCYDCFIARYGNYNSYDVVEYEDSEGTCDCCGYHGGMVKGFIQEDDNIS